MVGSVTGGFSVLGTSIVLSIKDDSFVNPILDFPTMQALQLISNMGQEATLVSDHMELMTLNALTLIPQHMIIS